MKNKGILIFLISLTTIIVLVIMFDFVGGQPDKRPDNPYKLDVEKFKDVDPELIKYKEIKQIRINAENPNGIYWHDNKIGVVADNYFQMIDNSGNQLLKKEYDDEIYAITFNANHVILAFKRYIAIVDDDGDIRYQSDLEPEDSYFTSVANLDTLIFVADAGKRRVIIFNQEANKISEFSGESGSSVLHGFIVPSANFDLAMNTENELWVTNPGLHALQNYSFTGDLNGYWEKSTMDIDGFSGCCNPAHFTFLPNGNFITSEKKIVRMKEYKPSGELVAVVAPPSKFTDDGEALDVTVDDQGRIWGLDKDKKLIRVFEKRN